MYMEWEDMAGPDYRPYCAVIEVDTSIAGARVVQVLERLAEKHRLPEVIVTDYGPEFTGKALDSWAYKHKARLDFIRPAKPAENAFIESFNGRLRDECFNEHWFVNLKDTREKIESWRLDYNTVRPHSSLGNLTPEEFIGQYRRRLNHRQEITSEVVQ